MNEETTIKEVKTYKKRFLMLAIVCYPIGISSMHYMEYSTIANVIAKYYRVSFLLVSFTAILADVGHVVALYPIVKILETRGIRFALIIGSSFALIAPIITCFTIKQELFPLVFIAQFCVGITFKFTYNVGPVLASKWFRNDEASLVIGVTSGSLYLSLAFLFLRPITFKNLKTEERVAAGLMNSTIVFAALSALCAFLVIVFIKNNPPQPANFAKAQKSKMNGASISLLQLLRNKSLILIVVNVFISMTVNFACNILLNQILSKVFTNEASTATAVSGFVYNISAIVGSLLLPIILDKTKRYQLLIFVAYSFAFIFSLVFMAGLWYKITSIIYASIFLFGTCLYGQRIMMYDLTVEVTYPFPEGTSVGLIMSFTYLSGTCLVPLLSWIIETYSIIYAMIVIESLLLLGFFSLFFISYKLLRNEAETSNASATNEKCEEAKF